MHTHPPTVHPGSPRVRATDPVTSHEAADGTTATLAASQAAVLNVLRRAKRPLTHPEIHGKSIVEGRFSASRIRTATRELVELGKVQAAGTTHIDGHKYRMTLWAVTA